MERIVDMAEPYDAFKMGSDGSASCMYIRQSKFPHMYNTAEGDKTFTEYDDSLLRGDYAYNKSVMEEYYPRMKHDKTDWFRKEKISILMEFCEKILKADASIRWTGFRILGGVNKGNGYPYHIYQLFSKGENSTTKVYSGENAPNVQKVYNGRSWGWTV